MRTRAGNDEKEEEAGTEIGPEGTGTTGRALRGEDAGGGVEIGAGVWEAGEAGQIGKQEGEWRGGGATAPQVPRPASPQVTVRDN